MLPDNYFTSFPSSSLLHQLLTHLPSQVTVLHPATLRIDTLDRISTKSHYHICLPTSMCVTTTHLPYLLLAHMNCSRTCLMQTCALDPIPMCLDDGTAVRIPPLPDISKSPFSIGPVLLSFKRAVISPTVKNPSPKPSSHSS